MGFGASTQTTRGRAPRPSWATWEISRRSRRVERPLRFEDLEGRQLLTASANIGIIGGPTITNGGYLPTSGPDLTGMTFTTLGLSDVTAANLANYDTIVLNVSSSTMGGNTTALSPQAKADLVSFVGSGRKLIIYDSESHPSGGVDYTWLPYPFTTNNPGAAGANGTLTITEENTLSSSDPSSPYYIDAGYLGSSTDAVGDANVMTTLDPQWCVDMAATNVNNVTGPVHTYAIYSNTGTTSQGLFIYNGLDVDQMGSGSNSLEKIWVQELQQPFDPVTGLPCAFPVIGIKLESASGSLGVGQEQTITATLTDLEGQPNVGVPVTFSIISGPNMGATGTLTPADGKTDANGKVTFTYVGTAVGTDTIGASFVNAQGQTINAQTVTTDWSMTAPRLTILMNPASDSGRSNTDQITNVQQPNFQGTADPGSVVQLTAQAAGQEPMTIGQMTVGPDGAWSLTSSVALPDGHYAVSIIETNPGREDEVASLAAPVIIDTVAPRVTRLALHTTHGGFIVVIRDRQSGMDQAALMSKSNYTLTEFLPSGPRSFRASAVRLARRSRSNPLAPQKLFVYINHGRPLAANSLLVRVRSLDVVDIAGNPLDGEFRGRFPSGNGHPGGNFLALFNTHHGHVGAPRPVIRHRHSPARSHRSVARSRMFANRLHALAARAPVPGGLSASLSSTVGAFPLVMGVIPSTTDAKK